jgi:uncharacterized phage protein (TIGR02218 family)
MSAVDLYDHLASGDTTVCRCWAVNRRDGRSFGFTDHDSDLEFGGITFRADTGLSAQALQQATGLSVDNSAALGALTDASLTEEDIEAGRFDGATVTSWLVNWAAPHQRMVTFQGTIGEIQRGAGAFRAELRGLTEALNQPQGLVYQKPCSAVLGDHRCRVDLDLPEYSTELPVGGVERARNLTFPPLADYADGWFERGRLVVQSGAAAGLVGIIKRDLPQPHGRRIEIWQALQADLAPGDWVRLEAGCDKRPQTCKTKFDNFVNYRGFPAIPGEDWLMAYPSSRTRNDGGSL